MFTMNMALIARAGAVALIGRRAEERLTAPLRDQADAEAVMNEVALAIFQEACRKQRSGLRGLYNRAWMAWRRFKDRNHHDNPESLVARIRGGYRPPAKSE